MTIPPEDNAPLAGGTPWFEQEQLLVEQPSPKKPKKHKKHKKRKAHYKKIERNNKLLKQQNAELMRLNDKAKSERYLWKALSNSAPKFLELISDVFNAFHTERMLDKQLSAKKGKKHKKGRKYYF